MSDTIGVLVRSQTEMRKDLRALTKSIERSFGKFDDRLGEVEEWKAGHIGFKKGSNSSEAKHISRVTFITTVVCAMLAVCGFLWALKPNSEPPTHAVIKDIVKEVFEEQSK